MVPAKVTPQMTPSMTPPMTPPMQDGWTPRVVFTAAPSRIYELEPSPERGDTGMATRENKFKAFFRSRSRSRSRSQSSDPAPVSLPPPSPTRPVPRDASSDNPPSSYLKSPLRPQNRPISSTTTATHSTITPLPSDSLRNRAGLGRHSTDTHTPLQDHGPRVDTCDDDSDDNHFPRSETPSSTRRKLAWNSFFGISLTRRSSSSTSTPRQSTPSSDRKGSSTSASSRKRSFRLTSRPTTPKSVDSSSSKSPYSIPIPSGPLPLSASPHRRSFRLGSSQRSTPKSSSGHLPLPHLQSSQAGRSNGRRYSMGSERPPHDSAVALPEESSHRTVYKAALDGGGRNKGKEKECLFVDSVTSPDNLHFDFPSQSLPLDPSPISRNHLSSHLPRYPPFSHLPTVDSASSEENEQSSHRLHAIPQITHTPPTPQRPGGEIDSPPRPSATVPRVESSRMEIAKGKTVAHREQVLVSSSQSHPDVQHTPSSKGRFTPRFLASQIVSKTKDTNGQKSGKRPPTSSYDGPVNKTPGSNIGLPRNMTSHQGKLGSFDFERPVSALNRSSSTVDQQKMHVASDNSSYSKARLHQLERTISEDSARGGKSRLIASHLGQTESPMLFQLRPDHTGDTSVISFSSVSLQTKSTGIDIGSNAPAGQSSSWGRASGRRILRTSHGTFAFEHPSSLPSSPNPHTFNLPNEPNQSDHREHTTGLSRSQPTTPLHAIFDAGVKHSRGRSCNTSDEPCYSNRGGRKSKGKGRSLDLGLGLSWAPSRLREEVLMPGLILHEKAKLEENRGNGSDITKTFESLLPEPRFQTFKQYVRNFDAHTIPLGGPSGLLTLVENLLVETGLSEQERSKLMSEFIVLVENHGG